MVTPDGLAQTAPIDSLGDSNLMWESPGNHPSAALTPSVPAVHHRPGRKHLSRFPVGYPAEGANPILPRLGESFRGAVPGAEQIIPVLDGHLYLCLFIPCGFGNHQDKPKGGGITFQENPSLPILPLSDAQEIELAPKGRVETFPSVVALKKLLTLGQGYGIAGTSCRRLCNNLPIHSLSSSSVQRGKPSLPVGRSRPHKPQTGHPQRWQPRHTLRFCLRRNSSRRS